MFLHSYQCIDTQIIYMHICINVYMYLYIYSYTHTFIHEANGFFFEHESALILNVFESCVHMYITTRLFPYSYAHAF